MATPSPRLYFDDLSAAWYDDETAGIIDGRDTSFYLEQAKQTRGAVLELACGTGRLLLPIARAGHHITGLDSSPHMLARAKAKLAQEPVDVQQRVSLVEADLRDFTLEQRYGLAFLAFSTFILLTTPDDQQRFLARAHEHLEPGGRLIIDVFIPSPALVALPNGHVTIDPPFRWQEGDAVVTRTEVVVATDLKAQTRDLRWIYDVTRADGTLLRRTFPVRIRYTYPQELLYLLERCGFTVAERLGGWSGESFEEGRRMVVIAEKAS
jgi:SAM-dependent methyltransferase